MALPSTELGILIGFGVYIVLSLVIGSNIYCKSINYQQNKINRELKEPINLQRKTSHVSKLDGDDMTLQFDKTFKKGPEKNYAKTLFGFYLFEFKKNNFSYFINFIWCNILIYLGIYYGTFSIFFSMVHYTSY